MGLLQFVDISKESPAAARIRYKLVEPSAGAVATAMAGHVSAEAIAERMEAAMGISDPGQKDKPLAAVVVDAAQTGQVETVKKALAAMYDVDDRNKATHEAAVLLAKHGLRKPAIDLAKGISDTDLRDQTLVELAQ